MACVLLLAILCIFISPFVPGPVSALRAQQAAYVFFFLLALYSTLLVAYLPVLFCIGIPSVQEGPLTLDTLNSSVPLRC